MYSGYEHEGTCIYLRFLIFSKVPAFLNVTDIAGLVKGAAEGQGLGNAFLSHIKACDALFHLTRKLISLLFSNYFSAFIDFLLKKRMAKDIVYSVRYSYSRNNFPQLANVAMDLYVCV